MTLYNISKGSVYIYVHTYAHATLPCRSSFLIVNQLCSMRMHVWMCIHILTYVTWPQFIIHNVMWTTYGLCLLYPCLCIPSYIPLPNLSAKTVKCEEGMAALSTAAVELETSSNDCADSRSHQAKRPIEAWRSDTNTLGSDGEVREETGGTTLQGRRKTHASSRPKRCCILWISCQHLITADPCTL